jgi:hypothetical protein
MDELNLVAKELFNKIRNRFSNLTIADENLKTTLDPEKARFYYFQFEKDGKSLGHINISLINNMLKIYYDRNIDKFLDPTDKRSWFDYLKNLRMFAKSNYPTIKSFDVRDIDKSGLNIKDLMHVKSTDTTKNKNEVSESKRYGTSKSSYENLDNVRIISRHKKPIVDYSDPSARSRNIETFYIENSEGERFKLPEGTTLNGARVFARHVKNGGNLHDDFGKHITKIVSEMKSLKTFVRNMRGRTFEDVETNQMIESAINYYGKLQSDLFTIRSQRGYEQYKKIWTPDLDEEDSSIDLDQLKERFVKRIFDDRLMNALPVVKKAYDADVGNIGKEFESWANDVIEDMSADVNTMSPTPKSSNDMEFDSEFDTDVEETDLSSLLDKNNFDYTQTDGTFYFTSREELERAKDIIAEYDPKMEFPEMEVRNDNDGTYGSSTFDRDLPNGKGVMEGDLLNLRYLAGLTK